MRKRLVEVLLKHADDPQFVFLTGDLGYKALEPLQDAMKDRFINVGIAEQNMVSVAAGLSLRGMHPWCYSIAPFLYARAFEQIRNDVAQPCNPVMLVGNGAGYQYGVMGPSHHALNDYGSLLTLPHMKCYMPAFDCDIEPIVEEMFETTAPCYLRLGVDEKPTDFVPSIYTPWRKLYNSNERQVVVVAGSIVGSYLSALRDRCNLWSVAELPSEWPSEFLRDFDRLVDLIVIEEHVLQGGLAQRLSTDILGTFTAEQLISFRTCCAVGYRSGHYGSKEFHRKENLLDPESIVELLRKCKDLS
jgi:transketolase